MSALAGLLSLLIGAAWIVAARVFTRQPSAGVAVAVATVAALTVSGETYVQLFLAVALLGVGGWLTQKARGWDVVVLAIGGLVLVTAPQFPSRPIFQASCLAYLLMVGYTILDLERRRPHLASILMFTSIVGIFVTVPRTDEALILLGGAGALIVHPTIKGAGAFPLTGLAIWAAVIGGASRTGSIVGALACFGLLIIEPLDHWLRRRLADPGSSPVDGMAPNRLLLSIHLLVVTMSSRVAGFREKSEPALVIALVAFAIGWTLMTFTTPGWVKKWWDRGDGAENKRATHDDVVSNE